MCSRSETGDQGKKESHGILVPENARRMAEIVYRFLLFIHIYAFCECLPSLQMLDSILRTSLGTFHNIFELVGFSSLLTIFCCLIERMSKLEPFNLLILLLSFYEVFPHNPLIYMHKAQHLQPSDGLLQEGAIWD